MRPRVLSSPAARIFSIAAPASTLPICAPTQQLTEKHDPPSTAAGGREGYEGAQASGVGGKRAYVAAAGDAGGGGGGGGDDVAGAERRRASHRHRHLKEATSDEHLHLVWPGLCVLFTRALYTWPTELVRIWEILNVVRCRWRPRNLPSPTSAKIRGPAWTARTARSLQIMAQRMHLPILPS